MKKRGIIFSIHYFIFFINSFYSLIFFDIGRPKKEVGMQSKIESYFKSEKSKAGKTRATKGKTRATKGKTSSFSTVPKSNDDTSSTNDQVKRIKPINIGPKSKNKNKLEEVKFSLF